MTVQPAQNADVSIGAGTPCVIYAAKSTTDTHNSLPDQLADGRAMAAREGWLIEPAWEFKDEAKSAYHGNRGAGLVAARDLAASLAVEHGRAVLVVQHSSRFARGDAIQAQHLVEVFLWAQRAGVELRSVQDDAMVTSLLTAVVAGDQNHAESKRKSESIKGGMRRRAEQRGKANGGPRVYGYRYRDTTEDGKPTGPLVPVDAEARVVERVFAEYIAGSGQRKIARDLNFDGIPTATGGRWYQGTVRNMLANPIVAGRVRLNGQTFDGKHEAIIDTDTWEQARQLREAMANSDGRGRGRYPKGSHLFTKGLLRCGVCGSAMTPVTKPPRGNGVDYQAYVCFRRLHDGPDACAQKPVMRDVIDGAVVRYFEKVALDVDATRRMITEQSDRKLAELDALAQQAERELAKVEAALSRIEGDYIAGKITADQWARLEAKLTEQIAAARSQAAQYEQRRQALMDSITQVDAEALMLEELTAIRQMVAGQAQESGRQGVESMRASLHRLFTGFELVGPTPMFRADSLDGETWTPRTLPGREGPPADWEPPLSLGDGYVLVPHVRPEAVDVSGDADRSVGSPALQRVALTFGSNKQDPLTR